MSKATAKNEIQVPECFEQLMAENVSTEMTTDIETILVEGSDSQIYFDLLEHSPANDEEKKFLENLRTAIKAGVKPFKVPVCDPSIDENGSLQFVAGCKPAVGYSYNELKKLASNNGVQLGSKNQYVLFLATIIHRLFEEGWSKAEAFYAVCVDSTKLGHYNNSANTKHKLEVTGSRKVAGKCDLANTVKILARDEEAGGFWIAGGSYWSDGDYRQLARFRFDYLYDCSCYVSVGWFVL